MIRIIKSRRIRYHDWGKEEEEQQKEEKNKAHRFMIGKLKE
jgi:hypothetical protein